MRGTMIVDLGNEGFVYVRHHLTGVNTFCTALRQAVDEHTGEVFTIAPDGITEERLVAFRRGGLLPENISETVFLPDGARMVPVLSMIDEQVSFLKQALALRVGAVCIMDDAIHRWSDKSVNRDAPAFCVGEEVYRLLASDQSDKVFEQAVKDANWIWHGVSAVCALSPMIDTSRRCSATELQRCALSVLLLTCTAYDGEGFVAWRRTSD